MNYEFRRYYEPRSGSTRIATGETRGERKPKRTPPANSFQEGEMQIGCHTCFRRNQNIFA